MVVGVVGRMRAVQRRWHGRSKIERVEFQSVVMWHALPWMLYLSWGTLPLGLNLRPDLPAQVLGWAMIVTAAAQCVHVNRGVRRALDHYLGRGPYPARDVSVSRALLVVMFALAFALQAVDGVKDDMIGFAVAFMVVPHCVALGFLVPLRGFAARFLLIEAVTLAGFAAAGVHDGRLLVLAALVAFGAGVALLSTRCSAWTLSVMWEADRAREVEARLAVAEERLRFGRDLHDVMGRNLAVIALKSELAAQLARRGRPEAVDQMVEVQRIAQQSQREIREVVRGYREAELGVELAGAHGVLEAAGITCRVTGEPTGLPPAAQSALGWVVREGTTNVLRHGDAQHCAITVSLTAGQATLTIENDGVPEGRATTRGTGLAGLRERLAAVGGTLEHSAADGRFRVTARVPVPGPGEARPAEEDTSAEAAPPPGAGKAYRSRAGRASAAVRGRTAGAGPRWRRGRPLETLEAVEPGETIEPVENVDFVEAVDAVEAVEPSEVKAS
ncbi:histidine kinase [Streptomyces longispororuber]|uniref:Histidine kinase n=1 Tax=Streptomyces longispororuber TaxID=68230 RepID=A0A918ZHF0_9ACTN|nr:sensor histidine kinase [Streptomyces longispororuber]GHE51829.1 histidine kinase [Streptomyces longispororuber]